MKGKIVNPCWDSNPRPFYYMQSALTTELLECDTLPFIAWDIAFGDIYILFVKVNRGTAKASIFHFRRWAVRYFSDIKS